MLKVLIEALIDLNKTLIIDRITNVEKSELVPNGTRTDPNTKTSDGPVDEDVDKLSEATNAIEPDEVAFVRISTECIKLIKDKAEAQDKEILEFQEKLGNFLCNREDRLDSILTELKSINLSITTLSEHLNPVNDTSSIFQSSKDSTSDDDESLIVVVINNKENSEGDQNENSQVNQKNENSQVNQKNENPQVNQKVENPQVNKKEKCS